MFNKKKGGDSNPLVSEVKQKQVTCLHKHDGGRQSNLRPFSFSDRPAAFKLTLSAKRDGSGRRDGGHECRKARASHHSRSKDPGTVLDRLFE